MNRGKPGAQPRKAGFAKNRANESAVARGFLLTMQHNPGLAVKRFKPRPTRTASHISVEVWAEYVDQHFKGGRGAQLSLLTETPSNVLA
jgi:hypothetical protein